jgi:1,4-alpha-glucan branching enzyme
MIYRCGSHWPAIVRHAALASLALAAPSPDARAQSKQFPGQLGSIVDKGGGAAAEGVTFRVWAPHAASVSVIGSFNNWDAARHPLTKETGTGLWSADVSGAKPGDEYLYLINGELQRRDPRARQVSKDETNSLIYDTTAFDWGDTAAYRSSALMKDLVIYQMHPGTFYDPTPADGEPGTLRDAIAKLDHLKEMGVNCVLLMPVNEFPGRHSWGYNPSDLFAVENSYGGPDALKEFIRAAHERGITSSRELRDIATHVVRQQPLARLEYIDIVDPHTLHQVDTVDAEVRVVIAVWVGDVRLIDNIALSK